jgi:hypothetical protein
MSTCILLPDDYLLPSHKLQINEMNYDNDLYLIDAKYLGGVYIQG